MISTSGGNLAIGISLLLRDGFSAPAATARASMTQLQKQQEALARSQMTMARNANLMGAAIGVGVISKMASWVKQGAEYGYTMKYVSSLTGGTANEMERLDRRAKLLGQNTMYSSKEVAGGMRFMAMAGMDATQIYDNVGAAVNLAVATMTELEGKGGTADIMTNIMKGFQIGSEHAARVADVLTTATTSANIQLTDLGETMKYAAATAMDLGVGLEEVSTMAMMAGNAGIQGTMAGTAIENMLRYLALATSGDRGKATEALANLGLTPDDLRDAHGNLKSIGVIMNTISKQVEKTGAGTADRQNWYYRLFGVRGKRMGSIMLRNMQDYEGFLGKLNSQSAGSAEKVAEGQMNTLHGRMVQWTDTLENLKIAYAEALEPVLLKVLWGVTKLLQGLNAVINTKFGSFLAILASGWVVLKTAMMAGKAVMLTIRLLTGQIGTTMAGTAASSTAGWNTMTAAASRYNAMLYNIQVRTGFGIGAAGAGIMGAGVRSGVSRTPQGGWRGPGMTGFMTAAAAANAMHGTTVGPQNASRLGRLASRVPKVGPMGFGLGMVGALGLGLASNAVGTESTGGKILSGAADTVNYGLLGASIGTFFGPVGTAAGALVGAVGGLAYNLYNQLKTTEEEVLAKSTEASVIGETHKTEWETILKINKANQQSLVGALGRSAAEQDARDRSMKVDTEKAFTSHITINLDGTQIFQKDIDDPNFDAAVALF